MNKLTIEITKDGIIEKLFYNGKEYTKTYRKERYSFMGNEKSWDYESELPDELAELLGLGFGTVDGTDVLNFFLEEWEEKEFEKED